MKNTFILPVLLHCKHFLFKNASHLLLLAVYGDIVLKHQKQLKTSIQKISAALCGIIQVFFIVSYAQYSQNTLIFS